jgi:folate-binding protein YgfZ
MIINSGILKIEGVESKQYLNSVISQDISSLETGDFTSSLLLDANGKTTSTFYIRKEEENQFFLICPENNLTVLSENLQKLLIRTKASIANISNEYSIELNEKTDRLIDINHLDTNLNLNLVNKGQENNIEYESLRIIQGAVKIDVDLIGTIAQEANLDKKSISFNKGCFLGQELVCRIDSRSAATPFMFYKIKSKNINVGDQIKIDNENIGMITSATEKDGTSYAIAKISRKGTKQLEESKAFINGIALDSIENVIGYFSL